jgi:hypothetical protein
MKLHIDIPTSNEWHILKGESQYGPYPYAQVIQMLQQKLVYTFDYVWSPHLTAWTTLSDLPEFSPERLAMLAAKSDNSFAFNRRESPRVPIHLPVYCHNNKKLWPGVVENLSAGGALILMENPTLLPGEQILLHFRRQKNTQNAFNSKAEILSKRLIRQKIEHNTNVYYAVRFMSMSELGKTQIKQWIDEKIAESEKRVVGGSHD